MTEKINALFVMDYLNLAGAHQWGNLPDDLWWKLVSSLGKLKVDGIGFQNVFQEDELPKHLTGSLKPKRLHIAKYKPYHGESSPDIAVFNLTDDFRVFLLSKHLNAWDRANEKLPYDEVCFFCGDKIRIQAVPYESQLLFYSFSKQDVRTLFSIDARFRDGLYYQDRLERVSM